MSTFNAGAVEASLTLGRSDWVRDLKKTKKEIEDLERKSITIGIDADDDNFRVVVDNVELFLEDLEKQSATVKIEADDDDAKIKLDRLDSELDRLDIRRVTFMVDADTDNAMIQLDNLEANLDVLDRDNVKITIEILTKEANIVLKELEARLDILDNRTVTIGADADITNALIQLDNLEGIATALDADDIHIGVDVDSGAAEAKLIALAAQQQRMTLAGIDIDVDVSGYTSAIARLATLDAAVSAVDNRTARIDVDVDRGALTSLVGAAGGDGSGGSLGLLKILIYALILLSPILAVAMSALTATIIAFMAAVAGAAGALLILVGGLILLVKKFKDTDPSKYTDGMTHFAEALDMIKAAIDTVMDSIGDEGFELMAAGLRLVAGILPRLVPLFDAVAGAMGGVVDGIQKFVDSPEFDDMLDFFGGFGVDMLVAFLKIGGNLLKFFGRLFQAIEPFARSMMSGLEDVTAGWAEWADDLEHNKSFQQFMENAAKYGPMVLDMLGSLVGAFMAIGQALEPFAGPMLTGLTYFFDLIANVPTKYLTMLIAGLAGLWFGVSVLVPMITGLISVFEILLGVIAFIASPIGLIVLAIVGLIAILVYLWKTNDDFRKNVKELWQDIIDTVKPIIEDIVQAIRDNWDPLVDWAKKTFGDLQDIVLLAFDIIRIQIKIVLAIIKYIWEKWGDDIIALAVNAFQIIGGIISGALKIIKGIFMVFKGLLTGDWGMMWDGIKKILGGAIDIIKSVIKGGFNIIKILFNAVKGDVVKIWNAIWDWAGDRLGDFVGWVKDKLGDMISWFGGLGGKVSSAVSGIWDGIGDSFRGVINQMIGWWNNLSFSVDIPDKIPGLPDSFTMSTPNVPYLAKGAYVTDPMMAMIGEGADNEVVAPEPVLERIVRENSGSNLDYGKMAAALAAVLGPILRAVGTGITAEQLQDLIEAASVNLNIDARSDADMATKLAKAIGFEMRVLGYGGKVNV